MIEVIYPEKYHKCEGKEVDGGYLFTCQECSYQRRMAYGEVKVIDKGDRTATHYGDAGVCALMDTSSQLKTALNDAAARCQIENDGVKIPKSFV